MRKYTALLLVLLLMGLTGCGAAVGETELYRTDTVIYIPAESTTEETEPVTETTVEVTETESVETETTEETVPETTAAAKKSSGYSSSSGKNSGSSSSSNKNSGSSNKQTEATTAPTEVTTVPTEPETVPTEEATEETTEAPTEAPAETQPPLYDISGYSVGSLEMAMMDAINGYRSAEGLGELGKNSRLCAIASARAYEASQSWSHTRPNGTYFTTVFQDYGFGCGGSAENLIFTSGGEDAAALVARWMEADGNRSNLMNPGFYTIGIGTYYANGCTYIACLLVG